MAIVWLNVEICLILFFKKMYILFVVGVVGEIYVAIGPAVTGNDVITFFLFWTYPFGCMQNPLLGNVYL